MPAPPNILVGTGGGIPPGCLGVGRMAAPALPGGKPAAAAAITGSIPPLPLGPVPAGGLKTPGGGGNAVPGGGPAPGS